MPAIIGRPETLMQLFPGEAMGRLVRGIEGAVHRSFCDENGKLRRDITRLEIKDRFAVCVEKARMFRGDLKWGLDRIIGQMDEVLRCHLAKIDYVPPKRQCWVPGDGQ